MAEEKDVKSRISLADVIVALVIIVAATFFLFWDRFDSQEKKYINFKTVDTRNEFIDIQQKRGEKSPGVDVALLSKPSEELLAIGKQKYMIVCAACHGMNAGGESESKIPGARAFTSLEGWKKSTKISDIYQVLMEGIANTSMTAQIATLPSVQERFAVIHYIRSINPAPIIDSAADIAALDVKYSLTVGAKQANQVPIAKAMSLLLSEKAISMNKIQEFAIKIKRKMKTEFALYISCPRNLASALLSRPEMRNVETLRQAILENPLDMGIKPTVQRMNLAQFQAFVSELLDIR